MKLTQQPEDLLTQSEVDNLPADTIVLINWNGNGPHQYRIHVDAFGNRGAYLLNAPVFVGALDFVGKERFHNKVSLAK